MLNSIPRQFLQEDKTNNSRFDGWSDLSTLYFDILSERLWLVELQPEIRTKYWCNRQCKSNQNIFATHSKRVWIFHFWLKFVSGFFSLRSQNMAEPSILLNIPTISNFIDAFWIAYLIHSICPSSWNENPLRISSSFLRRK